MKKNDLSCALALIYTASMFQKSISKIEDSEICDYTNLLDRLYALFEESYVYMLMMDDKCFDFSDVE